MEVATGKQIKDKQWRQGCFLPAEMIPDLAAELGCRDATHAIILSQDCDVTHPDLMTEPFVEILLLVPLKKIDPGLVDGKTSRTLHLEALQGGEARCFLARPWHQLRRPREILADVHPDATVSMTVGTLRGLIQWIADRYTRTGFPDGFVERIKPVEDELKKILKKEGKLFWRLLVALDSWDELDDDEAYGMDCVCVVWPMHWEDSGSRKKAEAAAKEIKTLIEGCAGVSLGFFEVDSSDEMPLTYLHAYRPWDVFNFLTHRELLQDNASAE